MKKYLKLILMMGLVLALIVGCSNDDGEDTSSTTTETSEGEQSGETAEGEENYGVVLKVLSSPFWQSIEQGIKDKAEELGVKVEVFAAASEDDVEGQLTVIENAISKGYTALAVAPLTADNAVIPIANATKDGLLVANVDEAMNFEAVADAGGYLVSFVATDNVKVGRTAADFIVEQVDEGAEVAIIEGKAGTPSGEDRKQGATEGFEAGGLTIVSSQPADWDRTKAYDLATNLLSKYENLAAIYCANDTMAMGAQEAVERSGRDVIVVGTDGNPDAIQSVLDGKLKATVKQDAYGIGARSLELLVEAYRNGEKPGDMDMIEETIDPILVIQENAQEHLDGE